MDIESKSPETGEVLATFRAADRATVDPAFRTSPHRYLRNLT